MRKGSHRAAPPARRLRALLAFGLAAGALALACTTALAGAEPSIGTPGPSFEGKTGLPTGRSGQSKLWWHDGAWWANLWDRDSGTFGVFRLEGEEWVDTGTPVDDRSRTRSDTLWDGFRLYVASHSHTRTDQEPGASRLYRFRYDREARRFALDDGFPVTITGFAPEMLVIAKDSTGRLWAIWTEEGQVVVNRTLCRPECDDAAWGEPFPLPVEGQGLDGEDIASIVAFGGDRIGALWSNQRAGSFYFAERLDRDGDRRWQPSAPIEGLAADDHISLKADREGRIYAAVKTSNPSAAVPLTVVLTREPGSDSWSVSAHGFKREGHTRPIAVVDAEHGLLHVFATAPADGGSAVYEKQAPLATLTFAQGLGEVVLGGTSDTVLTDATSTKQVVDRRSGLVVLASDRAGRRYWHHFDPLDEPPSEGVLPGGDPAAPDEATEAGEAREAAPELEVASGSPLYAEPWFLAAAAAVVAGLGLAGAVLLGRRS